ncbi:hypothetical protein [Cellvibrio sp. UBA7671]|uniref:hypothetical protein n=1 Tax=Cellvibrio sp. UBA7671 TaxID=1946312 RepID=UPI002F354EA0
MSLPVEPSLSARRCLLQQQLRLQRQQIIEQLCESAAAEQQFPRSATMRFLSGRTGLKLLTELAVRQLSVRYPGLLVNAFTLLRLFKNKNP